LQRIVTSRAAFELGGKTLLRRNFPDFSLLEETESGQTAGLERYAANDVQKIL
jgi:hypothetical protein